MDSRSDPPRLVAVGAAGVFLSAAGLYYGTGLRPVWWITWIAAVHSLSTFCCFDPFSAAVQRGKPCLHFPRSGWPGNTRFRRSRPTAPSAASRVRKWIACPCCSLRRMAGIVGALGSAAWRMRSRVGAV